MKYTQTVPHEGALKATNAELTETPQAAVWYLPLNVVVKPRKPGKVRLVGDPAASVNGISLNSELLLIC